MVRAKTCNTVELEQLCEVFKPTRILDAFSLISVIFGSKVLAMFWSQKHLDLWIILAKSP